MSNIQALSEQDPNPERWLAYELHDGLLQWVISARMVVESLVAELEPSQTPLNARLRSTLAYLENALEEGRELIGFLAQPQSAAQVDFMPQLASFIERIERETKEQRQTVTLTEPDIPWRYFPPRPAWNLLRIAEQALRNAVQHAGECSITVRCGWRDARTLSLEISDNGRGFEPHSVGEPPGHFGLASMQHRAALIGAQFTITSTVGSGTSILLTLPIAALQAGDSTELNE